MVLALASSGPELFLPVIPTLLRPLFRTLRCARMASNGRETRSRYPPSGVGSARYWRDYVAENIEPILEEALENLREATGASAGHREQDACRWYARAAQLPEPLR